MSFLSKSNRYRNDIETVRPEANVKVRCVWAVQALTARAAHSFYALVWLISPGGVQRLNPMQDRTELGVAPAVALSQQLLCPCGSVSVGLRPVSPDEHVGGCPKLLFDVHKHFPNKPLRTEAHQSEQL